MTKLEVLKRYWGYTHFRPHQEQVIEALLSQQDCLAVLPTGAGKSLCYQLPALLQEGVTLVISPLIALMQDQVQQLKEKGIKALHFSHGGSSQDTSRLIDNSKFGDYKLLYFSPERIQQEGFLEQIQGLKVSCIAVDEAHCISEWGIDFRPAYRQIAQLQKHFPKAVTVALTASATAKVKQDIEENLNLKNPINVSGSFERSNIAYHIFETEDKWSLLYQWVHFTKGTSIVYCETRKQTLQLSNWLQQKNIAAAAFHGGMTLTEKKQQLNNWQQDKLQVMVATNAFGMGIDKANVRLVVHFFPPDSLERYYQETGRAGRDGKPANAVLFLHKNDCHTLETQLANSYPEATDYEKTYKNLCNYLQISKGSLPVEPFTLQFSEFCTTYKLPLKKTWQCFNDFEQMGIIACHAPDPKKWTLKTEHTAAHLLSFFEDQSPFTVLLEYVLRKYPSFPQRAITFKPETAAYTLSYSQEKLASLLNQLDKMGVLEFQKEETDLNLQFLVPREEPYTLREVLQHHKTRKKIRVERLQSMVSFLKHKQYCLRNQLLAYFGEKHTTPCQQCSADSCSPSGTYTQEMEQQLLNLLAQEAYSIAEIKEKLFILPQALSNLMEKLIAQEKIELTNTHKLILKK
jgi:ATP-dependent DNA helicase RecQ